jgi:hypothetical protein
MNILIPNLHRPTEAPSAGVSLADRSATAKRLPFTAQLNNFRAGLRFGRAAASSGIAVIRVLISEPMEVKNAENSINALTASSAPLSVLPGIFPSESEGQYRKFWHRHRRADGIQPA